MTNPYEDGYRAGLEAAAKVCDEMILYAADDIANTIRILPVPESKQPSVEDVARAIAKADFTLPDEIGCGGKPRWTQYVRQAKAAMRAWGMKVE